MTQTFKNRNWKLTETDETIVSGLMEQGLSSISAKTLAGRGIDASTLAGFLNPKLSEFLPNPSYFLDMDETADYFAKAFLEKKKIGIWSDYDVDGATSGAILAYFVRMIGGGDVDVRIPDRITEGYGPNIEGMKALKAEGYDVVCILDAGTTAFEPLEAARDMGLDVIVIDHHVAENRIPPAIGVVNPNRQDQPGGYEGTCAAGMAFLFCVAVNLRLRKQGHPGVDLRELLGLVALGTICDVMPLVGLNRAFVYHGLPRLSQRTMPGVAALADAAQIGTDIDARACGFGLGPRINAGGRIGDSTLGVKLLLAKTMHEAEGLAGTLDRLNKERQDLEKESTSQAISQLEGKFISGKTRKLAWVVVEAHEGVVGITASRVKDTYDVPTFVVTKSEGGYLKGSGRSVKGFDLGAAVMAAREKGLLVKGGGHGMAAGITIEESKVDAFIDLVNDMIKQSEYYTQGVAMEIDACEKIDNISLQTVQDIDRIGPFGNGHAYPRILMEGVRIANVRESKGKHLLLRIGNASDRGQRLSAPIWNCIGTPLEEQIKSVGQKLVDVVCSLEINEYNGSKSVQLRIEDMRLHQD